MKIIIKGLIVSVLLGACTYMGIQIVRAKKEKDRIAEQIQRLPDFTFISVNDGEKFSSSDLIGLKTILLYFNSTCDFCQEEIKSMVEYQDTLNGKDIAVVLVSEQPKQEIEGFMKEYGLNGTSFIVLKSEEEAFYKTFGSASVPSSFIYNEEGKLVKKYKGLTKIEALINQF